MKKLMLMLITSPEDGDLRFQDHLHTQNNSPSQDDIQQQLMNCIKELEKENKMLVPFFCGHVDKYLEAEFGSKEEPYADINFVLDALPSEIMRRLKEIVKLMVDGGFVEECSDIYSTWRREFAEQCLLELLQFQLPIKMDFWKWSAACKAAWKMFFPNERRLCDFLFSGLSVAADVSFDKFCKSLTTVLLEYAHTITTQSYTQYTLLVDAPRMLMSLGKLEPEFIAYNNLSFVRDVRDIQQRLAMINSFRYIIYPDIVEAPATDGGLHLITKESMNYILGICEGMIYQRDCETYCIENSSFWVVIGKMIELLESELELESTR
ncbi:Exocyst complex component [Vigna angularis]|uniref:Exocyst subunit Exo70 family protein n=1 Tax=Phaseolus angularis TaxID=3914 RepID=A0A8T0K325_PHAAN|nr:exocyst complex component EXO70B1 [Vigna angularis]KAG2391527.1 Exocyst complex component [Vigna angularis]